MAITIASLVRTNLGHKRCVLAQVTLDTSYPTGGYTVTPQNVGLREINGVLTGGILGYHLSYTTATQKLLAHSTAGTEVTNATNVSTVTGPVLFIGI